MQRFGIFLENTLSKKTARDGLTNAETAPTEYQGVIREPHRNKLVYTPLTGIQHGKIYLGRQNE